LYLEQGRSAFDIRHRVAGSAVWQPGYFHDKGTLAHWLADGFSFSPVVALSSGGPYSGFVSGNVPAAPGVPATCSTCSGVIGAGTSSAFARVPFIPRDDYTMPYIAQVDFRVSKKFWYKERASFELITDIFNVLNHQNVSAVSGATTGSGSQFTTANCTAAKPCATGSAYVGPGLLYSNTFGVPTNTSTSLTSPGQRTIQIGAKLTW
jgi:hypothetical protein